MSLSSAMSSLICNAGKCTFTRVNTNATAIVPPRVDKSKAPWFLPQNQDKLSPLVAITRDYTDDSIFNALDPDGNSFSQYNGPSGTEWALLPDDQTFANAKCDLAFCDWNNCFVQYGEKKEMIGKPGVVHLIEEDLYYSIMFTAWQGGSGGGFQYVRDEKPIKGIDLGKCPVCGTAKANPSQLLGPIDNSFVNVTVTGVSANTTISIRGVGQEYPSQCNLRPDNSATGSVTKDTAYNTVLPNAKINADGRTVALRRFRIPGELSPFTYTVYFRATNAFGSCDGSVKVCVPAPGFGCNYDRYLDSLGQDATASTYCNYREGLFF